MHLALVHLVTITICKVPKRTICPNRTLYVWNGLRVTELVDRVRFYNTSREGGGDLGSTSLSPPCRLWALLTNKEEPQEGVARGGRGGKCGGSQKVKRDHTQETLANHQHANERVESKTRGGGWGWVRRKRPRRTTWMGQTSAEIRFADPWDYVPCHGHLTSMPDVDA